MSPAEKEDQFVSGEAYRLKDIKKVFEMLDIVEEVKRYGETGALFRRAIIDIEMQDGSTCPAWCYMSAINTKSMQQIESGKWERPI
jgi:gamma-glutamylcyclotransferase (GGCT)/AIG2-like uncharacterized protein YtfP